MVVLTRSELIERLIGRTKAKQSLHGGGRNNNDMLLQAFDVKSLGCFNNELRMLGKMVRSVVVNIIGKT